MGHVRLGVHDAHGSDDVPSDDSHYRQRKALLVVVLHYSVERVSVEGRNDHVVVLEVETLDVHGRVFVIISFVHSL